MTVNMQISSYFQELLPIYAENKDKKMEVADGTSVRDLLKILNIPENEQVIIVINGSLNTNPGSILNDGDSFQLYPMMAGG